MVSCGVDLESWTSLGESWEGLGQPWGRHGCPRSIFDRFGDDVEARLGAPNRTKSIKNRCRDAFKLCIGFRIDFLTDFDRFGSPCGHHLWVMLGIIWRIGDRAKNMKDLQFYFFVPVTAAA